MRILFRSDRKEGSNPNAIYQVAKQKGDQCVYISGEGIEGYKDLKEFDVAITNNGRHLRPRQAPFQVNTHHGIGFLGCCSPEEGIDLSVVPSDAHRLMLIDNGYNPKDVVAVGTPRMDSLYSPLSVYTMPYGKNVLYAPTYGRESFGAGTKYFWAFSNSIEDDMVKTKIIGDFVRKNKINLVVRVHTNYAKNFANLVPGYVRGILGKNVVYESMLTNPDSLSRIEWADYIITDYSSIAFESTALSKPIIFCNPNRRWQYTQKWFAPDNLRESFGWCVSTAEKLCSYIADTGGEYQNLRAVHKAGRKSVHDKYQQFYGGSAERAYQKIKEIYEERFA